MTLNFKVNCYPTWTILFFNTMYVDHINYSRWVIVQLENIRTLSRAALMIFTRCDCVVPKHNSPILSIIRWPGARTGNWNCEGKGGVIGLTENAAPLQRWFFAGPELARLLKEFDVNTSPTGQTTTWYKHHHEKLATQRKFFIPMCLHSLSHSVTKKSLKAGVQQSWKDRTIQHLNQENDFPTLTRRQLE